MTHIGVLELFRIGIGPSSSHTVGPMRAASAFCQELIDLGLLEKTDRVRVGLYGSLGATGEGHGTIPAIIRGLAQDLPESCNPIQVASAYQDAISNGQISLGSKLIPFAAADITMHPLTRLPSHSNGMRFSALNTSEETIHTAVFYSVGGGFIERDREGDSKTIADTKSLSTSLPYPFLNSVELISLAEQRGLTIAEIALENDLAEHGSERVFSHLALVWETMRSCIESGLEKEGLLPGSLKVNRRAKLMSDKLQASSLGMDQTAEWLQVFAIAVNEQNAAGGRVVTAPTNGAAGIIPAVALWAQRFREISDEQIERVYLPTAAAIGKLYKLNASISGAEAGCQGEVGSACSMAAAGVTALFGGTPSQIENAAEIAMEHNLGLTCDPVGGYVQLPCIERNAIAAGTAVAAMRLALMGDGSHKISLDTVIETMRQTGEDMSSKYKETSMGGLAVNVVEC